MKTLLPPLALVAALAASPVCAQDCAALLARLDTALGNPSLTDTQREQAGALREEAMKLMEAGLNLECQAPLLGALALVGAG